MIDATAKSLNYLHCFDYRRGRLIPGERGLFYPLDGAVVHHTLLSFTQNHDIIHVVVIYVISEADVYQINGL